MAAIYISTQDEVFFFEFIEKSGKRHFSNVDGSYVLRCIIFSGVFFGSFGVYSNALI